jgi:hypothetical protein
VSDPNTVVAEVTESESVVSRGTRRITWLVYNGSVWVHLSTLASCVASDLPGEPGVVWARLLRFEAAPGTRLVRVQEDPAHRQRLSPLGYLTREVRSGRRDTHRTHYRVSRNGTLLREAEERDRRG